MNTTLNNKTGISTAYNDLGLTYSSLKQHKKAIEHYLKSLVYKPEKDKAITFSNIAISYTYLNNNQSAEEYFLKAIQSANSFNDPISLCTVKKSYGGFKTSLKEFKQAEKILKEANSICHKSGNISGEANTFIFLGLNSIEQNHVSAAKKYYDFAKPLVLTSGSEIITNNLNDLELKISKFK